MTSKQFSIEMSKLILKYEDSEKWIEVPQVMRWWNIFLFSAIIVFLVDQIVIRSLNGCLLSIGVNLSLIFRTISVTGSFWLLLSFIMLSLRYYKFLLLEDKDLRWSNILSFYFGEIFLFSFLYFRIYSLNPSSFTYINPPCLVTEVMRYNLKFYSSWFDFLIYSALISLSSTYYKISSNSNSISLLNVFSKIYVLFIVIIVITTFIQKITKSHKNE